MFLQITTKYYLLDRKNWFGIGICSNNNILNCMQQILEFNILVCFIFGMADFSFKVDRFDLNKQTIKQKMCVCVCVVNIYIYFLL